MEKANKSSYNEWSSEMITKYVNKATEARENAINAEKAGDRPTFVEFTTNSKLKGIATFGTLPIIDCCKACKECKGGCYAIRHQVGVYSTKLEKCARNSARLACNRDSFFADIEARSRLSVAFRWHESGEVTDYDYFDRVVKVAKNTPHCAHLIFTKRHDIVNNWIKENGSLPENLFCYLSAWKAGIKAVTNPYGLPVAAPDFSEAPAKYRKDFDDMGIKGYRCAGDCSACYLNKKGCFDPANKLTIFKAH